MSVEITGLDGVDNLHNRVESLGGEVPMSQLFTTDFMQNYTSFDTFGQFLDTSDWDVETKDDFENIPEEEFDDYVAEHTGFDSWETMLSVAGREYVIKNLN